MNLHNFMSHVLCDLYSQFYNFSWHITPVTKLFEISFFACMGIMYLLSNFLMVRYSSDHVIRNFPPYIRRVILNLHFLTQDILFFSGKKRNSCEIQRIDLRHATKVRLKVYGFGKENNRNETRT